MRLRRGSARPSAGALAAIAAATALAACSSGAPNTPDGAPDTAADAVRGQGSFTEPQQVQALARIYSNYTHVVVQRSSGITTMADFRGKRAVVLAWFPKAFTAG